MENIKKLSDFLNKNLTIFILFVTGLALAIPNIFIPIANVKIANLSIPSLLLAIIMFGTGITLIPKDIIIMLKKPKYITIGVIAKYTFMIFGAFLIAKFLKLNNNLAFGLILLGSMPPGTAASVITFLGGGDITFSVAIIIFSTFLAPIVTPFLTFVFGGQWIEFNFISMFINIIIIVLLPILLGMFVKHIFKDKANTFQKLIGLISIISLLLIVSVSTAPNRDTILSTNSIIVIIAVALNFVFAALGNGILAKLLKLDQKKAVSLIITSCEQNSALSVGIASTLTTLHSSVAIPSIIAVSLNLALTTILANIFQRKVRRNKM
ncbi:bile acid:sodium symporter family protein [Miniphocaeibacter halophilus]|uniref:Bile acid:sodium symporter family protein n=1 Tax=Miniphocaeibacter halophilus TaxID=2931922 RepID=A0AC61MU85_9FIRM|nr:bile acid:sodium symporter family protein [Miniphocaeibacter halophilus]